MFCCNFLLNVIEILLVFLDIIMVNVLDIFEILIVVLCFVFKFLDILGLLDNGK